MRNKGMNTKLMKSEFFRKILKINEFVFPVLLFSAFLFSLVESFSYIGYLKHYFLVDSRFFIILTLISGALLIGSKIRTLSVFAFKINTIALIGSLIMYLLLQLVESIHFHNYIFSNYHIQPTNFLNIVILSLGVFLISRLLKRRTIFLDLSISSITIIIFLTIAFLDGAAGSVDAAVYTDFYILTHFKASYDFKMEERWGSYYNFIKFVKLNTPENASILVPPQQLPWLSTGNVGLDRYFLFPRNLSNGSFDTQMDLKDYDYVLLVWGEWGGIPNTSYGWPKVPIKAEKIIYFDFETGAVSEKSENYDPKLVPASGAWGIIKIEK